MFGFLQNTIYYELTVLKGTQIFIYTKPLEGSMSESITEEKSRTQAGKVSYSVERMDKCSHPKCDSRRKYGVKVTKVEPRLFMDLIQIGQNRQSKIFCPEHRDSVPESREAIRKEHEVARKNWHREKKRRRREEFAKIVESNILPTFRYRNGSIGRENGRFNASKFDDFEHAVDYIQEFDFEIPILIYEKDKYAVVHLLENKTETVNVSDDEISYEDFHQRFSDVEFADRQFYPIKTNSLTGMKSDQPVNKIEEHIEDVLEWKEYDETQGYIDPYGCNLCDGSWGYRSYSRAIIDGEEVIIVSHNRCGQIIGELNKRMVDERAYDINIGRTY